MHLNCTKRKKGLPRMEDLSVVSAEERKLEKSRGSEKETHHTSEESSLEIPSFKSGFSRRPGKAVEFCEGYAGQEGWM
jgi:hypothetical protein